MHSAFAQPLRSPHPYDVESPVSFALSQPSSQGEDSPNSHLQHEQHNLGHAPTLHSPLLDPPRSPTSPNVDSLPHPPSLPYAHARRRHSQAHDSLEQQREYSSESDPSSAAASSLPSSAVGMFPLGYGECGVAASSAAAAAASSAPLPGYPQMNAPALSAANAAAIAYAAAHAAAKVAAANKAAEDELQACWADLCVLAWLTWLRTAQFCERTTNWRSLPRIRQKACCSNHSSIKAHRDTFPAYSWQGPTCQLQDLINTARGAVTSLSTDSRDACPPGTSPTQLRVVLLRHHPTDPTAADRVWLAISDPLQAAAFLQRLQTQPQGSNWHAESNSLVASFGNHLLQVQPVGCSNWFAVTAQAIVADGQGTPLLLPHTYAMTGKDLPSQWPTQVVTVMQQAPNLYFTATVASAASSLPSSQVSGQSSRKRTRLRDATSSHLSPDSPDDIEALQAELKSSHLHQANTEHELNQSMLHIRQLQREVAQLNQRLARLLPEEQLAREIRALNNMQHQVVTQRHVWAMNFFGDQSVFLDLLDPSVPLFTAEPMHGWNEHDCLKQIALMLAYGLPDDIIFSCSDRAGTVLKLLYDNLEISPLIVCLHDVSAELVERRDQMVRQHVSFCLTDEESEEMYNQRAHRTLAQLPSQPTVLLHSSPLQQLVQGRLHQGRSQLYRSLVRLGALSPNGVLTVTAQSPRILINIAKFLYMFKTRYIDREAEFVSGCELASFTVPNDLDIDMMQDGPDQSIMPSSSSSLLQPHQSHQYPFAQSQPYPAATSSY